MKRYVKKNSINIFTSDNLFRSVNKQDENTIKICISKKMFPTVNRRMNDAIAVLFNNVTEAMKNGQ